MPCDTILPPTGIYPIKNIQRVSVAHVLEDDKIVGILRTDVMIISAQALQILDWLELLEELKRDRQVVSRDRKWGCATFCHAAMLFAQSFQRSNAATRL